MPDPQRCRQQVAKYDERDDVVLTEDAVALIDRLEYSEWRPAGVAKRHRHQVASLLLKQLVDLSRGLGLHYVRDLWLARLEDSPRHALIVFDLLALEG